MAEEKPRLARLTAIITQLQSKSLVTAKELAQKHDVSIRTVYRDIRTLEKSGIPIVTEEGKGYSMMQGYRLPPIMFTEDEAHAMLIAEKLIQQNKDESLSAHFQQAIEKIKSVLLHTQKEKTELLEDRIQIRDNHKNVKTSTYLIQLQAAITNFKLVRLEYFSLKEEHSQRTLEPFALYTTQGNWLLIAYCRERKDFRSFRLDRIQQMYELSGTFQPHDFTLEEYLTECRKKWQSTPDIPLS
ncbi:MAG: YafY family protein [Bacteroidota bacterium]